MQKVPDDPNRYFSGTKYDFYYKKIPGRLHLGLFRAKKRFLLHQKVPEAKYRDCDTGSLSGMRLIVCLVDEL